MIVLWIIWAYLMIGFIVSQLYERKLCADIREGKVSAMRLERYRINMGDAKFWFFFNVATTLLYGLFVIRLLFARCFGDVELPQD